VLCIEYNIQSEKLLKVIKIAIILELWKAKLIRVKIININYEFFLFAMVINVEVLWLKESQGKC